MFLSLNFGINKVGAANWQREETGSDYRPLSREVVTAKGYEEKEATAEMDARLGIRVLDDATRDRRGRRSRAKGAVWMLLIEEAGSVAGGGLGIA